MEMTIDEGLILGMAEKRRSKRLSLEQVRALERAFQDDSRLEAERKVELAREVGLQERQVAVWFQNRRARCRTKQMECEYDSLKKKMESVKADRDELVKEKERLEAEVLRLKGPLSAAQTLETLTEISAHAASSQSSMIPQIKPGAIAYHDNDDVVEKAYNSVHATDQSQHLAPSVDQSQAWDYDYNLLDLQRFVIIEEEIPGYKEVGSSGAPLD